MDSHSLILDPAAPATRAAGRTPLLAAGAAGLISSPIVRRLSQNLDARADLRHAPRQAVRRDHAAAGVIEAALAHLVQQHLEAQPQEAQPLAQATGVPLEAGTVEEILAKLDTEAAQSVAARYGIRSIPTMIAFKGGRWKNLLLFLVIAPFFTSFLIRTISWRIILGNDGPVLAFVRDGLGLVPENFSIIGTPLAVVGCGYNKADAGKVVVSAEIIAQAKVKTDKVDAGTLEQIPLELNRRGIPKGPEI